jgi:hypothetical protein
MRTLLSALLLLIVSPVLAQSLSGGASPDMSNYLTMDQVQSQIATQAPALAPVQAVNTKTGLVSVPTLCRQQSTAIAIPTTNPGTVSWTFPNATCNFSTPPSCWMDISTASNGYVFDQPMNTARTTSAVTYTFTAHAERADDLAWGSVALSWPACELHGHDDLHGSASVGA